MSTAIELFTVGITVSFGPCLVLCSPVILPYIAATRKGWKEGLGTTLIFLFTRLLVYGLLGLLVGLFGRLLTERFYQFGYLIYLFGGLFISLIGILVFFGKEPGHYLCQILRKKIVDDSIKTPIMLGLIVGVLPCLPVLGVLAYIALEAESASQGTFYGLAFGAGKFVSPLIPLGVLASVLPSALFRSKKIFTFFRWLCGVMLIFIGVNLIVSHL